MTYSYIRSKDVVAHISRRCVFPVKLLWFCSPFAFISEIIASALVAFWSDSHLPDQQAIALWAYFVSMVTTGFIVLLYDAMLLVCFLLYLAKMRKRGDSISTEDVKFTTIAWHGTFGCVSVFAVICLVTAGFLQHGLDTPYSNVFLSLIALTSSAICLNMIVLKIRLHYQRISDKPSSVENTYGLKEKLRNVLTELNHSMSTSATMKDTSSNK
ncbi:hypothetical protein BDR26DRAFT_849516 [Obelidium mucronatum]|nr:hypothetical protein BDR26DRAFT_849516 [Obelidium mucronatum]